MPPFLTFLVEFFVLPALVLGWVSRTELRRYRRTLLWCLLFVYTAGLAWDWLSVRTGVWRYDSARTLGIWRDGLPVEELVGFYLSGTLLVFLVVLLALKRSKHV
ncbi:MAG: lycopene cyclase domain-containing protein [Gemmatimonadota bacterium]